MCFDVCVTMCYNVARCVIQFLQAEASCGEVCVTIDRRVQTANDKLFQARKFFQNSREIISGFFHFNFVIKILSFFQVPHVHFEIVLRLQADINAAAVRNEMYCPAITENKICKM